MRYAVGIPNGRVRGWYDVDPNHIGLQLKADEVAIEHDGLTFDALISGDGKTISVWQDDIATLKRKKWSEIKTARDAALLVATTTAGVFDCDDTAMANINGQVTALMILGDNAPATVDWRMHDNSTVTFSSSDFMQAALLVAAYRSATYQQSWTLEAAIDAATTADAINALIWPLSN